MSAFTSKYMIIQKICEGSFSEVLKCKDRISQKLYAAKILKKSFSCNSDILSCAEIIALQKLCKHPNVLHMHDYFFETSSGTLILILELMDMNMQEFIQSRKRCIPESRVKNYLYQILQGLDYLHRHGLFHRDIKPENILVKLPSNSSVICNPPIEIIKLADFGSVREISSKPPYTEYISTRWYRSPECLLTIGHYGPKMDIWAVGCVFYEVLTREPLFPGNSEIDQLAKIHAILGTPSARFLSKLKSRSKNLCNFTKSMGSRFGSLMNNFSKDAQAILRLMLQYNPEIRSSTSRLLQHKYFTKIIDEVKSQGIAFVHFQPSDHAFMSMEPCIPNRSSFISRTAIDMYANHVGSSQRHMSSGWPLEQRNICRKGSGYSKQFVCVPVCAQPLFLVNKKQTLSEPMILRKVK